MSSTVPKGFPPVAEYQANETEHRRELARAVNRLNQGKFNSNFASFTLAANASSTTLTDARIYATTIIVFMPTTANAAAALSGIYITGMKKGSCTVNHANDANIDKTFALAFLG